MIIVYIMLLQQHSLFNSSANTYCSTFKCDPRAQDPRAQGQNIYGYCIEKCQKKCPRP